MRFLQVIAVVGLLVFAAPGRAEVVIAKSLEWLTYESDLVLVGQIENSVSRRAGYLSGGQVVEHEVTLAVKETIKGKATQKVSFRLDSLVSGHDERLAACLRSREPTLVFLQHKREKDVLVVNASDIDLPIVDLAAPGRRVFDATGNWLAIKERILQVCRDTAAKQAEHARKYPKGRVVRKTVPAVHHVAEELRGAVSSVIIPEFVPDANEAPPGRSVAVPEEGAMVPKKTPYDGNAKLAKEYRGAYREGYEWAGGRHVACPTNPSDHNLHAIRGWIEGWQAGVIASGQRGGPVHDLPAKYAPFLGWKEARPLEMRAPEPRPGGLEETWDLAKFPKLTGKLGRFEGSANSYLPPDEGDSFALEFAVLGKLTTLEFGTKQPHRAYMSLYGPLRLARVNTYTTGEFESCRFTSKSGERALHIDLWQVPGRGDPRAVTLFITAESSGLVTMCALVECLAEGKFPTPRSP